VAWPDADVLPASPWPCCQELHDHTVEPIPAGQVSGMLAAFAVNTTVGVRAIGAVDGTELPTEFPALDKLRESFLALRGERLQEAAVRRGRGLADR